MLTLCFVLVAVLAPISTASCLYLLLSHNGTAFSSHQDRPQAKILRSPVVRVVAVRTNWPERS